MQTLVSFPHHDYPASVRSSVEDRLTGLDKYFDRIVSLRAILEKERKDHRVEIVANVGHGVTLVVDSRDGAFSSALDEAVCRMRTVLSRHKEKLLERSRGHGRVGH